MATSPTNRRRLVDFRSSGYTFSAFCSLANVAAIGSSSGGCPFILLNTGARLIGASFAFSLGLAHIYLLLLLCTSLGGFGILRPILLLMHVNLTRDEKRPKPVAHIGCTEALVLDEPVGELAFVLESVSNGALEASGRLALLLGLTVRASLGSES